MAGRILITIFGEEGGGKRTLKEFLSSHLTTPDIQIDSSTFQIKLQSEKIITLSFHASQTPSSLEIDEENYPKHVIILCDVTNNTSLSNLSLWADKISKITNKQKIFCHVIQSKCDLLEKNNVNEITFQKEDVNEKATLKTEVLFLSTKEGEIEKIISEFKEFLDRVINYDRQFSSGNRTGLDVKICRKYPVGYRGDGDLGCAVMPPDPPSRSCSLL